MNITLKHLILHSLVLNNDGAISLQIRPEALQATPAALALVEELHLGYNSKAAKGFGYYGESSQSDFKAQLEHYLSGDDFTAFSNAAGRILVDAINKYQLVEQGVLLIAHYEHVAGDYLLITVLENKHSASVNENLDITSSHYLETNSMLLAGRIALTDMQRDPQSKRYVSYIKGRAGRKVADFFVEFLGCEDGLDIKQQNTVLMEAVDEYCASLGFDSEEKQQKRGEVKKYCNQQLKEGDEIFIKDLSEVFGEQKNSEQDFYQFAAENYPLEAQFPADRSSLKKLDKYFGQGKGVSLSFERSLLGDRVHYDEKNDTITIVGIPPNLREQLKK